MYVNQFEHVYRIPACSSDVIILFNFMALTNQLWFFIWENFESQSFAQIKLTLEDVKRDGVNLNGILKHLSLSGDEHQYSYLIHSESMKAAVQVLTDKAVHGTWQLYCQQDPVVTISVRKNDDPSPSTSRTPSYSMALIQRRSASGQLSVPDIPIHTPPRQVSSGLDPVCTHGTNCRFTRGGEGDYCG
jgi:hypothetical protein